MKPTKQKLYPLKPYNTMVIKDSPTQNCSQISHKLLTVMQPSLSIHSPNIHKQHPNHPPNAMQGTDFTGRNIDTEKCAVGTERKWPKSFTSNAGWMPSDAQSYEIHRSKMFLSKRDLGCRIFQKIHGCKNAGFLKMGALKTARREVKGLEDVYIYTERERERKKKLNKNCLDKS